MTTVEEFIKSKNLVGVDAHVYTERDSHNVWTLPQLLEEFHQLLNKHDCSTRLLPTNAKSCSKCKHFKQVGFNDYECNLLNDDAYITSPTEQVCDRWESIEF